jgi:hypothetical protein
MNAGSKEIFMRITNFKKAGIPKIAVLATGLAAAVLVVTINPVPVAQAFPSRAQDCANCHTAGGSTTATPNTLAPAAGATYTVAISLAANPGGGNSGYAIEPVAPATERTHGGDTGADLSFLATMTAPAAAGTYTYNVFTNQGSTGAGHASSATYSITVGAAPTVPSVVITAKPVALTALPGATFSFVGTDSSDPADSLLYQCSIDGAAASACTSPKTYAGLTSAAHRFTVTVRDPAAHSSSAAYSWRVDRVAPTVTMTAPATVYALTTSLVPAWTSGDVGGGLANVDVRWQRAAYSGGFTAFVYPSAWQRTTATRVTLLAAAPGYTHCFSARARDKAGNLSAWSASRCSAVALDDRSLVASAGWARVAGSVYYRSTATTTTRSAVTLTRKGVQARRIYLVATKCPTCGTVGVYWNGALLKKVSLASPKTTRRNVLAVTTFTSVRTGTLTIRTLINKKSVQIDGITLVRG